MEVVINACFGGFSLSPKALLWLWEQGVTEIGMDAEEYYGTNKDRHQKDLKEWKEYDEKRQGDRLFITVFSPDEKFVLYGGRDIRRDHPKLVECVKLFGEDSYGGCAELKIIEIPDDVQFVVEEYDGNEHIAEVHRTWS